MLLGTSWPPSRMQCLKTSWVDPPVLFSLRFQIRAVESPDLQKASKNIRGVLEVWGVASTWQFENNEMNKTATMGG